MEPMNLKDYQREVLKDLNSFMNYVDATGDLKHAFAKFWEERGVSVSVQNDDYMHPYRNDVNGVPNVTVKVPTAGGKTFIACNAIDTIFKHYHDDAPRVVAWFVPSDTILKQTYRNLSNTDSFLHLILTSLMIIFGGTSQCYMIVQHLYIQHTSHHQKNQDIV